MTVTVSATEIAEKDYSEIYGTVTKVVEHRDSKTNEIRTLDFTFFNGEQLTGIDPEAEFDILQGGLTDHGPIGSIREGLAADHPDR